MGLKLICTNKNDRLRLKMIPKTEFLTCKALLSALGINIFATTNQALSLYGHQII